MSLFEHADFDQHEQVSFFHDKESGLKAIIAVHNTKLGASLGGCRMWPYASSQEALTDVLRLSSGMTYKAALAGLPQGGGKAVIIGNPRSDKTQQLMYAMGKAVDTFKGQYVIAEDSGISVQDLQFMATQSHHVAGTSAKFAYDGSPADGNPAPSTAYGVFMGLKAAVEHATGSDLNGKTVAIQGVGHVGLRLARHLKNAGANLIVADIFAEGLEIAKNELGATVVDPNDIHAVDADVFAPCAMGGAINNASLSQIKAKIIAGAANNQLATPEMDVLLKQRGITYVPDYLINAGGIIDIFHQRNDSTAEKMRAQLEQIGQTVKLILGRAQAEDLPTGQVANQIAEEKFRA
ncbi:amino acid dehydrogenase [Glaciecola sp. XM2]|jgi:leucine dehydrogenase|uniref:Glu/Leu/Phe/Val dehydrogenase dimerization domain-containing protein n=1 Tax=Glaciecola sp. XM2 TaxID=1914931 RepID=UPI001BDEE13C|nr:Glu/Leu/Phe/Val dehydrogenase dimerization domain-containing protein [Glaciecola sp. XM2]MBT1450879.1 amino acid dehydrogenase [Glaciecola sp. XM2]